MSYTNRAAARVLLREDAAAVEDATKALERNRSLPQAYAARAMASFRLDKGTQALEDCNAGLKLAPENPNLLFCRALLAEKRGGRESAPRVREDLEKALDLGGSRWAYRDEAEAVLQRVRDKK